jgi:hypothetical protein
MLTNEVHRDFTFLHPEILSSTQCSLNKTTLVLNNKVNKQIYKVLIVPGGKVISIQALEKIEAYYKNGGKIIFTSMLPSKSAEFGSDARVVAAINQMLHIDPNNAMPPNVISVSNQSNGQITFIPKPTASILSETLEKMGVVADLQFENNPQPNSAKGTLSYLHKIKAGKDIYFFENSSDDKVDTWVNVRGRIKPSLWNPYDGTTTAISEVEYITGRDKQVFTRFPLKLDAIQSMFVVGE